MNAFERKILGYRFEHQGFHGVGSAAGGGDGKLKLSARSIEMVEGNMGFDVYLTENNELTRVDLVIHEVLRHFESMCVGKNAAEIALIVQRICGVCPFPYAMAAVKSVERAFGIHISEQAFTLRQLAVYGAVLNSHILHAVDLMVPRLLGTPSIIPVAQAHPELAKTLLSIHRLGNDLAKTAGGREVHGIRIVPGGMSMVPKIEELQALLIRLREAHEAYDTLVGFYAESAKPVAAFSPVREREFIAVYGEDSYPFYSGLIRSSKAGVMDAAGFKDYTEEYQAYSNSKQVRTKNSRSYMVGALARLNLNGHLLCPQAVQDMEILRLNLPSSDPFMNTQAQLVEGRQILVDAANLLEKRINMGIKKEAPVIVVPKVSSAAGFLEAPRGFIWHEYSWGDDGLATAANCIIPTGMNTGSMQEDIEVAVTEMLTQNKTDAEMHWRLDYLLGSYDPCNSCAVHFARLGGDTVEKVAETKGLSVKSETKVVYRSLSPVELSKVAIVSLGNALCGDDAIGSMVIDICQSRDIVDKHLTFMHGGVVGLPLFYDLEGYDAVLFVDAVDGLSKVGEMVVMTGDEFIADALPDAPHHSLHESDFTYAYQIARAANLSIPKVVRFIGIQIGDVEGDSLSSELDPERIADFVLHEYGHLVEKPHAHHHED